MTAMVERSEVQYGKTRIEYVVHRSARRGTVAIAVDPEVGVVLRAPAATPIGRLDDVVHRKAQWIVEQIRDSDHLGLRPGPREFVSGETYLVGGRQHRLQVIHREETGVRLDQGRLVVAVTTTGRERDLAVRYELVAWYRARAADRLPVRLPALADRLGVQTPVLLVREQPKRWGSCDAQGRLRINWRVIQAAPRLQDYVLAHELVHLDHRDHTRAFWSALGRAMPDYEARQDALRALGPRLVW